ncbi:head-tail connector protein [Clostridium tunisiense]|uniref:head-tail connector protein n=1 Tax=Clostridium tunisiense TaxID=219748 RepID=UPI0002DE20C2|nr:head-tail connector protein [Clostridium tunisiense]
MTLEEVKSYLRVDYDEDNNYITDLIEISEIYIDECCGTNYKVIPNGAKLASLVQRKLIYDMYENRATTISENIKRDKIVETIFNKLSLMEVVI